MTIRLADLKRSEQLLAEHLQDPDVRARWERTALARAVALRLLDFRVTHGLSQTQLARRLGMHQPAIARLETGEHNPSVETLYHLSKGLGIEFLVDIAPTEQSALVTERAAGARVVEQVTTREGGRILVAAH